MAKKKKKAAETPDGDQAAAAAPGGKKKIFAGVAALALVGGGYVLTSGGGSSADASEPPAEEVEPEPGTVVTLDAITLNLADGRFLKVDIALQLVAGTPAPAAADVAGFAAPALDEAISTLGAMSYDDLVAPGGRDAAKAALSSQISERYQGDVLGVYFTELVMQ